MTHRTLDEELLNLTRERKEQEAEVVEEKPKRKRGRPKKEKKEKEPLAEVEQLAEANVEAEHVTGFDFDQLNPFGEADPADIQYQDVEVGNKQNRELLMSQIADMKKRFNVEGTGLQVNFYTHEDELKDELSVLSRQVDAKRADDIAFTALVTFVKGVVEPIATRLFDPNDHDYSGLGDEVIMQKAIFKDALDQISILHRSKFAVSPYTSVLQGVATCAVSCEAKNRVKKQRAAREVERPANDEDILG